MLRSERFIMSVAGAALLGACADQPESNSVEPSPLIVQAAPLEGSYEFQFRHAGQQVSQLSFGQPVTLHAIIKTGTGAAAQKGSVIFQYCSLKGRPPNDITRVDEAPFEACDVTAEGTWANLGSVPVNASGIAEWEFCCPQITPVIGFRYKYLGHGSGILNWTVTPQNFHWVE